MTKMKSKKMTKSTFAIIIMAVAMIALLAFGGTYAYFTATTDPASNTGSELRTGKVMLNNDASATLTLSGVTGRTVLLPGDTVNFTAQVGNQSNVDIYVFVQFKDTDSVGITLTTGTGDADWKALSGTDNVVGGKTYAGVYYKKLAANATSVSLEGSVVYQKDDNSHNGAEGTYMNKPLSVTAQFGAIQFDNLTNVGTAFTEFITDAPNHGFEFNA